MSKERQDIIAALVAKTGIKLDFNDPAFLLVEINLLMLERAMGQAAADLDKRTADFSAVTVRNVDDFVTVANEALSKFIQRTNEIKAALDLLHDGLRQHNAPAAETAPVVAGPVVAPSRGIPPWLLAVTFAAGAAAGAGLSLAF